MKLSVRKVRRVPGIDYHKNDRLSEILKSVHVIPEKQRWAIVKSGGVRDSRKFESYTDALKVAAVLSGKGRNIFLHRKDGRIREIAPRVLAETNSAK